MFAKVSTFEEQYEQLSQKYRGLRKEDLEELNPSYSCVLCKKFAVCGRIGRACFEAEPMTEEQFSLTYNFEGF